ncbi:MAG: endonuclease/exonuclease/phosphatase family protein [Spirochaetales bacterium]
MRLKISTFNAQNLILPGVNFYGTSRTSPDDYMAKCQWIAGQLNRMDADLVGFQEVFHRAALENTLRISGQYAHAEILTEPETQLTPRVALVSRLPVRRFEWISEFPAEAHLDALGVPLPFTRFHRPILKAWIALPNGVDTVVFVVHLKSKRPMVPEGRPRHDPAEEARGMARSLILRACEAAALRLLVLAEIQDTNTPVILMGDLNDSTHSVTNDILQGRIPQRNFPQDVKKTLWDILLYSCADLQARKSYKDVYYTHLHDSHYESLDHIYVSQEFVNENPAHIGFVEYMRLYNDHLLDPALTDEPAPVEISDHGQPLVCIRLREAKDHRFGPKS